MARSSSEAADLILLTKDAKIRLIGTLRPKARRYFQKIFLLTVSCQLSSQTRQIRRLGNLMPLLFRRLIGKKHSMYGSTHSDCDASSLGEASVSLLPPPQAPAHQDSNNKESSWKRQAWCMACLAFTMAAVAGVLGAYVIFIRDQHGVSGGSVTQAARGSGGGVRRPLPLIPKREPLKPP